MVSPSRRGAAAANAARQPSATGQRWRNTFCLAVTLIVVTPGADSLGCGSAYGKMRPASNALRSRGMARRAVVAKRPVHMGIVPSGAGAKGLQAQRRLADLMGRQATFARRAASALRHHSEGWSGAARAAAALIRGAIAARMLPVALALSLVFGASFGPLHAVASSSPSGVAAAGPQATLVRKAVADVTAEATAGQLAAARTGTGTGIGRLQGSMATHGGRYSAGAGRAGTAALHRLPHGGRGMPLLATVPTKVAAVPKASASAAALTAQHQDQSLMARALRSAAEIADEFEHHIQGSKRDTLILLLATSLVVPLSKRAGLSPILGFLATGMALGPNGLSVVCDVKATEVLGELGIVFFLFEMGLELSLERLKAMRKDVFGLGLAQFGVTAAAVAGVGALAGLTPAAMVVVGGGVALSSSAFVLQLLRDRDDLGTRYGRACFGILLFQDLAVVPLLVAIPLLVGGGGSVAAALGSAAAKAVIALTLIAFIGKTVLDRFFFLVARSKSQEAFLAVILLTVLAMSSITEGLGLSNTLGAFLAGTLLSETKYRHQVEADIAPFRGMLLGLFFMTVGFEIDLRLVAANVPLVSSLVVGLLSLKAAIIALVCLGFGLSLANAQQTGLLLSQGGEFAFVAFGMAERLGILSPSLCKLLLTTVAISMATTPALSEFSAWIADQIEERMGFSHYVGQDSESQEIRKREQFVVVCGYGRIGRLVCDLLDRKFIPYVAFEINPQKAMEARNRGLPVFYGDVTRPEVLKSFNVGNARAVICTLSDIKGTNKAVVSLRREFPDLPLFVRAKDSKHQKRLQSTMDVVAMVPVLPEDSIMVSLPFGGAVLRSLGLSAEEVNVILEDTRKKFILEKGLDEEEQDNLLEQLGITGGDDTKEEQGVVVV